MLEKYYRFSEIFAVGGPYGTAWSGVWRRRLVSVSDRVPARSPTVVANVPPILETFAGVKLGLLNDKAA